MEAIRVSHFALYYGQLCGTGCVHAIPCRGHQRNESAPSEYGCALQRPDQHRVFENIRKSVLVISNSTIDELHEAVTFEQSIRPFPTIFKHCGDTRPFSSDDHNDAALNNKMLTILYSRAFLST